MPDVNDLPEITALMPAEASGGVPEAVGFTFFPPKKLEGSGNKNTQRLSNFKVDRRVTLLTNHLERS